ncbi:MAG: lysophospholipid acyltransferase family protein [bacterium]|nr:lysophospholipid acyltransferase family protein [bacterium]
MKRWRLYLWSQRIAGLIFYILSIISYATFGLLFFRLRVVGRENVENLYGPLIVTPNHKSYVDHFFLMAALPFFSRLLPARAIAADWLFEIPNWKGGFLVRWTLWLCGAYPTRRGSGLDVSLRKPLEVLRKGYVAAIYPEGGIRFRPGVHPVKIGAAYLAQKSGAPILPVAICGIEYLSWRAFLFGRKKVSVVWGTPLYLQPDADMVENSECIRSAIAELYEEHSESNAEAIRYGTDKEV